jgi:hypothetical protein
LLCNFFHSPNWLISVKSKYPPQHFIPKHSQSLFLSCNWYSMFELTASKKVSKTEAWLSLWPNGGTWSEASWILQVPQLEKTGSWDAGPSLYSWCKYKQIVRYFEMYHNFEILCWKDTLSWLM